MFDRTKYENRGRIPAEVLQAAEVERKKKYKERTSKTPWQRDLLSLAFQFWFDSFKRGDSKIKIKRCDKNMKQVLTLFVNMPDPDQSEESSVPLITWP